ncbi:Por secretion system C-terminal sorting domain-containing protein [Polaribacter sp. KT25b]|uniref:T9SS type A sorting domain-containing protein n=1 Tax=Polaribacter sp. KT25b TaxID=1855336 RepID=UPI00087CFAD2|nr:T9SS type A sorting domain-containing protein [Polaribacter sp. KT25b]SDR78875.1 Por secretion system C-terminal sorting domain-containing protein [Polaribacter sp. KT25b]
MKKITFLLFTIVTTAFFGQEKLTSSLSEYFNGEKWVSSNKATFTYDNDNNFTEEVEFYWDSSTSKWIKSYASKYVYNDDNRVISETYENYDATGNIDGEQYKTINTYNSSGDLSQILNQKSVNSNWVDEGKFELSYTDNRLSSALGYEWNGATWIFGDDSSRITLTYNANGKVYISKSDSWDGTNWIDSDRTVYTYDANNRIIVEDGQTWDGTNWETDYKSEYTYDANGNAITEKDYYLDDDVLVEGDLETITFDTSKLISSYLHPFKDRTGIDYIFSANGIVNKILARSSTNYRTTYNYGDATANVNNFSLANFTIYPNPATSVLNIDDSNFTIKNVEVYNVLGKKIVTSSINQLNIENLVNGVYLVKVQDDKGNIATKRFVKN